MKHTLKLMLLLIGCAAIVAVYWTHMEVLLGPHYRLDLGSINFPTKRIASVWRAYALWGTLAAVLLLPLIPRYAQSQNALSLRFRWVVVGFGVFATLASVAIQGLLLKGAALTDDESAYKFAAATLQSGHLAVSTPAFGAFLDRQFLVLDDHMFVTYFLGWPALLAAFGLVGAEQWSAAAFTGLSVVPLAFILRRFCKTPLIVAGLLIFTASFMVQTMGATMLAHASTTFFLLCFIESAMSLWHSVAPSAIRGALCGLFFCITFFIRPATALAMGAPFLFMLASMLWARPRSALRAAIGFGLILACGATAFLSLNQAIYGGYLNTGYSRFMEYMRDTGRDVFGPGNPPIDQRIHYVLLHPLMQMKLLLASIQRLTYDFFGWPLPIFLLSVLGALREPRIWFFVVSALASIVAHALIVDFGIDSFGPVHLFEAGVLLIVVFCAGAQALCDRPLFVRSDSLRRLRMPALNPGNVIRSIVSLTLVSWFLYFPLRAMNLYAIASDVRAPLEAAENIAGKAIVFVGRGITSNQAAIRPLRHLAYFMPINDPGFQNRILWVQDLGDERNASLLTAMPDRRGFRLGWTPKGQPVMLPLAPT